MDKEKILPIWRVILIFLVAAVLLAVLALEVIKPIDQRIADRYMARGDSYFLSLQFPAAVQEYERALKLNGNLTVAQERLQLAKEAPVDIAPSRDFFASHGVPSVVDKIDQAEKPYTDPKEALKVGVAFYDAEDYSYARYPIERAVSLDPSYPEAWNYLALTYDKLATIDPSYHAKADAARAKRDALTPKYLKGTVW